MGVFSSLNTCKSSKYFYFIDGKENMIKISVPINKQKLFLSLSKGLLTTKIHIYANGNKYPPS